MKYHKLIGFPKALPTQVGIIRLVASRHALARAAEKGIKLPISFLLDTTKCECIEIEIYDGKAKYVFRQSYSPTHDIVFVCVPQVGRLVTVWLNSKDDAHYTLDKTAYDRP